MGWERTAVLVLLVWMVKCVVGFCRLDVAVLEDWDGGYILMAFEKEGVDGGDLFIFMICIAA